MAFVIADRVRETSVTTGTGSIALGGAVTGYQTFDAVLNTADTTFYTIADQGGANWEVGIGTFTSPSTLARTTILSSSNGGSIVTFGAGTKDVFISLPASKTNVNDQPNVVSVNSSSDALLITQVGSGNALVVEDSANPDSSPFVVDSSGNVGIGTSSPASPLHVVGDARLSSINSGPIAGFRNAIINGNFNIAQRGTSFVAGANNDDTYNLDRWYVLSDGNDVVDITQSTTQVPTNGSQTSIALDVETINKKFGIAQIIEQRNCQSLIGNTVTLSFKVKVSSTTKLDNVKAAIVAWSGTADTVTSDIISAWNVEGTNPTLIANATYENSPANLSVTTSWATYSITAAVDTASTGNIIVFIWSDVTDTTLGDFLYITDVQIELGPTYTPFERRTIGTELSLSQRYYCETRATGRFPSFGAGQVSENQIYWPVTMRAAPTITITSGGIRSNLLTGYPQTQNSSAYGARWLIASNASGDCYAVNDTITAAIEL
jgi:hypothetical protein